MQKLKRILALIGAILLIALYASTLVFSLMSGELAQRLLLASIFCTVAIPILLYAFMLMYKVLKGRGVPKDEQSDPDSSPKQEKESKTDTASKEGATSKESAAASERKSKETNAQKGK